MQVRLLAVALTSATLLAPSNARAAQGVFGYQLGVSETFTTSLSDDESEFLLAADEAAGVVRLTGLRSTTAVVANLTYDIVGRVVDHAFLVGLTVTPVVPLSVPVGVTRALDETTLGLVATAGYIARHVRPRWGLAFGTNYGFSMDSLMGLGATGADAAFAPSTVGDAGAGSAFLVRGQTHVGNVDGELQLTRFRWDATFGLNYGITHGGLSPVGVAGVDDATLALAGEAAGATSRGEFVRATTHALTPSIVFRRRVGRRHTFSMRASTTYTLPDDRGADPTEAGPLPLTTPETLTNGFTVDWAYTASARRTLGALTTMSFGLRTVADASGRVAYDRSDSALTLAPDAFVIQLRGTYDETLRWGDIEITASLGVGVPMLMQWPIGQATFCGPKSSGTAERTPCTFTDDTTGTTAEGSTYAYAFSKAHFYDTTLYPEIERRPTMVGDAVAATPEPVFTVTAARTFEPVRLTVSAGRNVGLGTLGAPAIVTNFLTTGAAWVIDFGTRALTLTGGASLAEVFGAGSLPPPRSEPPPTGAATDAAAEPEPLPTDGFTAGLTFGAGMPLFDAGDMSMDATFAYGFRRSVVPVRDPFSAHTMFLTLRATYGRGPLQAGRDVFRTAELDAFTRNPESGSPLVSARLINQGARFLDGAAGRRPGEAPRIETRAEAWEQNLSQTGEEPVVDGLDDRKIDRSSQTIQEHDTEVQRVREGSKETAEPPARDPTPPISTWPMGGPPASASQPAP